MKIKQTNPSRMEIADTFNAVIFLDNKSITHVIRISGLTDSSEYQMETVV
jgi:hypothetical protein